MFDEEREEQRIASLPRHLRDEFQPDGMSAPAELPQSYRPFRYRGKAVPVPVMRSLQAYLLNGTEPGRFVRACLENDFTEAALRADDENRQVLDVIAAYLYAAVPSGAWGSHLKVESWLLKKKPLDSQKE